MKLTKLSKLAFVSSLFITGSAIAAEESKIAFDGYVRASLDRTDSNTARPNFTNDGYARLNAISKKVGNDQLWGLGRLQLNATLASAVTAHQAYAQVGGDSWDLTAGRFLVAKFTDFVGNVYDDGFYLANSGATAHYELRTLDGRDESLALHYNHSEDLKLELAIQLGQSAADGATSPATKDVGFRPFVEYKRDNMKFMAGLEMVNKDGNQDANATYTKAMVDKYKQEVFGFGLGFGYELGDLCFGLTFASQSNETTPAAAAGTKTEVDGTTFSGKVGYKVNEDWKLGLTIVSTTGETKVGAAKTEADELGWLLAADYNLAAGTTLRLGHSVGEGETTVTGSPKVEASASQTKVELKYVF